MSNDALSLPDVAIITDILIAQSEKTDSLYLKREYLALITRVQDLNKRTATRHTISVL